MLRRTTETKTPRRGEQKCRTLVPRAPYGGGMEMEAKEKKKKRRRSRSPNSLPQPPETFPLEKRKENKDSIVFFCHPHSDLNERGRRRAIPTDFNLPESLLHSTWPHDCILLVFPFPQSTHLFHGFSFPRQFLLLPFPSRFLSHWKKEEVLNPWKN